MDVDEYGRLMRLREIAEAGDLASYLGYRLPGADSWRGFAAELFRQRVESLRVDIESLTRTVHYAAGEVEAER